MKHYSLLAKISREHGGMTRASFRRSRSLADAGEDVEILTFNMEPDLRGLTDHIRANGELGKIQVRNMHTDFCLLPDLIDPAQARVYGLSRSIEDFRPVDDLEPKSSALLSSTQDYTVTEWVTADGISRRFDLRDRDGDLFFVDERKADTPHARRLTLLDPKLGVALLQGGSYAFQAIWLDSIIQGNLTAITIDGVAPGEAFANYSRPYVLKFLVQHSVHQRPGTNPKSGPIEARVLAPLRNNRSFDALVTLTQAQREHLLSRVSPAAPVVAIPNVNPPPDETELAQPRDRNLCVIVSRLEESNKQISHILKAIALARSQNPQIHAEFYGGPTSGKVWEQTLKLVEELSVSDAVSFLGHQEDAIRHFSRAGFTALTSRFEGQSLALVEAMSRGAVPISYNVDYGPAEIIDNGKTGFLLPADDVQALADTMVRVATDTASITQMRREGVRAAQRFSEEVVTKQWQDLYASSAEQLPLRERLRTARSHAESVLLKRGDPVVLQARLELPLKREERKHFSLKLQAIDHHTLLHTSISPKQVSFTRFGAIVSFEIASASLDGLGRRDITAWLRVTLESLTMDVRVSWDASWGAWPARSPSGQLNLR